MSPKIRLFLFILFICCARQTVAVEFTQCIDLQGNKHITNLGANNLDKNCQPVANYHDVFLQQDYLNLEQERLQYLPALEEIDIEPANASSLQDSIAELLPPSINDLLDPDKALEQLLDNTRDRRENFSTDFFKARSDAVKEIMKADPFPNPDT